VDSISFDSSDLILDNFLKGKVSMVNYKMLSNCYKLKGFSLWLIDFSSNANTDLQEDPNIPTHPN